MTEHRLSILHISDLHARSLNVDELPETGRENRRRDVQLEAASRAKVLGDAWDDNLRELYPSGERPDLVCFTGDVADWGLQSEYTEATKLIDRLVAVLGVERSQIYVVPGNHDVRRTNPKRKEDRKAHKQWEDLRELLGGPDTHAASKWIAGKRPPRAVKASVIETVMGRTAAFWRWVEHDLGRPELLPAAHAHGRLGYHHVPSLPHLPFPVHVIGLDSAWLAGDDHDLGKLWLTQHQRDLLLHDDEGKPWSDGFRLSLVHHPIEELATPECDATRRDLANAVDLLLHGHQHDPVGFQHIDPDGRVLRVLAAGCLFEGGEGSHWKNGCHRIDVALDGAGRPLRANIHFRAWSSRGHWHSDSSLYSAGKDGRMVWDAWGSGSGPQRVSNLGERPPVFEGRDEIAKAEKNAVFRPRFEYCEEVSLGNSNSLSLTPSIDSSEHLILMINEHTSPINNNALRIVLGWDHGELDTNVLVQILDFYHKGRRWKVDARMWTDEEEFDSWERRSNCCWQQLPTTARFDEVLISARLGEVVLETHFWIRVERQGGM